LDDSVLVADDLILVTNGNIQQPEKKRNRTKLHPCDLFEKVVSPKLMTFVVKGVFFIKVF
jgi:hypothetical protein